MTYEDKLFNQGCKLIAGVDEAGRGPLAGPVVAAAVILPKSIDSHLRGSIKDSKELSEHIREQLYARIIQNAIAYGVAQASPKEIDTINIRQAALLAMRRAVEKLNKPPDYVLVDGRDFPQIDYQGEALVKGDQKSVVVGAASIIAKVVRDRILTSMHHCDTRYGFGYHKGYPTKYHRIAVQLFGPSPSHRTSFAGVKENLLRSDPNAGFQKLYLHLTRCKTPECYETYLQSLAQAKLSEEERFYLKQSAEYRMETALVKQRRTLPATVDKGEAWETFAAALMESKGYTVWERNYKTRGGELDLVCNKGSLIVFAEVKGRRNEKFGTPIEAVTPKKQTAIVKAAEHYLYERDLHEGWDIRYDVISILAKPQRKPELEHIEDAFRVEERFG